jgi:hypothetical protein
MTAGASKNPNDLAVADRSENMGPTFAEISFRVAVSFGPYTQRSPLTRATAGLNA